MKGDILIEVGSKGKITNPAYLLRKLGIKTGSRVAIRCEENHLILQPADPALIRRLNGSCKGKTSIAAAREREHKREDRLRSQKLSGMS